MVVCMNIYKLILPLNLKTNIECKLLRKFQCKYVFNVYLGSLRCSKSEKIQHCTGNLQVLGLNLGHCCVCFPRQSPFGRMWQVLWLNNSTLHTHTHTNKHTHTLSLSIYIYIYIYILECTLMIMIIIFLGNKDIFISYKFD